MSAGNVSIQTIKIHACRVCRDNDCGKGVMLNDEGGWCELFEFCIGIQVNVQEEPRTLCETCANNLCSFAEFKKQCLKSDSLWKSLVGNYVCCYVEKYDPDIKLHYDHLDQYESCTGSDIEIKPEIIVDNICYNQINQIKSFNNCDAYNLDTSTENKIDVIKEVDSVPKSEHSTNVKKGIICSKAKTTINNKQCEKVFESEVCSMNHMKSFTILKKEKNKNEHRIGNIKKHSFTRDYLCGLCRFTDRSQAEVLKHFGEHVSRNDLECKICEFVGRDFAEMVSHRLIHNSVKKMVKQSCPTCKKICLSKLKVEFHYRSTHLNKIGGYCFRCNKEFPKYRMWKYHINGHADNNFVCDICGKKFSHRKAMIIHMLVHSKEPNVVCHLCGKGFRRSTYLSMHMNTVHANQQIQCTHCNKLYKNSQSLKSHMKRLETKSSLKCEYCAKCFATPHMLKNHTMWHTDEKPYSCDICGSCFKAKCHLKIHIRNHTGVKPFSCDVCNKCFLLKRQLKRHASVHTKVRPHKCPHCERTFYNKKQVQMHCEQRHKSAVLVFDKDNCE